VVGAYAAKYPTNLKKVMLISPIGVKVKAPDEPDLDPLKRFEGRKGPPRWARGIAKSAWKKKVSPFSFGRKLGKKIPLTMIGRYVAKR